RQHLGQLGLAHAGVPLDEQRLPHLAHQVEGGGDGGIGDVALPFQVDAQVFDGGGHVAPAATNFSGAARKRSWQPMQQKKYSWPWWPAWGAPFAARTVMPQTGSRVSRIGCAAAAASTRGAGRSRTISARMLSAISSGRRAPSFR